MRFQRPARLSVVIVLFLMTYGRSTELNNSARSFFSRHCVKCHSGDQPKADWRIGTLSADFADAKNCEHWENVLEQLTTGDMPPEKEPRSGAKETRIVRDWITAQLRSLYRDTYHYSTYISTAQALRALALCGELPLHPSK